MSAVTDYRGQHAAPDAEYGAPLWDVSAMMPDYYTHPEWFRTGDDECDGMSERAILRCQGNPDAPVWMWRAVPAGVTTFNPGDWVTTSKPYARQHMADMDGWHVIARRVRARELFTEGNSINEWGWWPQEEGR